MSIGRLRRNLDLDLIERMKNNGGRIPRDAGGTLKRVSPPRAATTYRGNRRLAIKIRRGAELATKRKAS